MTTNEQTPHEQFDELLEALWAGELDRNGEAMLEALAAGAPELAERLRRERSLTSMLLAKGPNLAPEGLAAAVFARMDEQPAVKVVEIKKERRPWFFAPQLRWGLAAAALVVVGVQGMWAVYRERPASPAEQLDRYEFAAASAETKISDGEAVTGMNETPKKQTARPRKSTQERLAAVKPEPTATPKAIGQDESIELAMAVTNAEEQAVKPSPVPTQQPKAEEQAVKPSPAPTPEPKTQQPVPAAELQPEKAVAAAEPKTASPVIAPGGGAWRAKPSRFEVKPEDRVVAAAAPAAARDGVQPGLVMRIDMAAAQPVAESAQPAAPAQTFSRTNMVRAFAPAEPQRALPMTSFAPQRGGGGSVRIEQPKSAAAAPAPVSAVVTHDQIEQAIAAAGGTVKAVQQTRINPPMYKIDASIPQANLPGFIERLNQMGIKAAAGESAGYSVLEGEELLTRTDATTPTQQRSATQIALTILFDETHR